MSTTHFEHHFLEDMCHTDSVTVFGSELAVPNNRIYRSELFDISRSEFAINFVMWKAVFLSAKYVCNWRHGFSSNLQTCISLSEMRLIIVLVQLSDD